MDVNDAINYINDLCRFGINLGLDRTNRLISMAGNPDKKYYIIHVAGTNGKGSTSAMLRSALVSSGFKTGLYTSPHIHSYRERIQLNDEYISEEDFAKQTKELKKIIDHNKELFSEDPTEFEFLTIMAASYFAEKEVDFAIFETGLGGRLDSTNALDTDLSIITNIGIDHKEILGDTIELIASEKAKIIREKGRVIVGIQEYKEAESVLYQEIIERNAEFIYSGDKKFKELPEKEGFQCIYLMDYEKEVSLNLQGRHQIDNMLNVVSALEFLKRNMDIDTNKFFEGLSKVNWPGRLERFKIQNREIIIDGAHNPQGARKIKDYLDKKFLGREKMFLMGILDEKDKEGILDQLYLSASEIIVSRPSGSRTQNWNILPEKYQKKNNIFFIENPEEGLDYLINKSRVEDLILSFGSFYFISEVREIIIRRGKY